jgi:hypothetical protein
MGTASAMTESAIWRRAAESLSFGRGGGEHAGFAQVLPNFNVALSKAVRFHEFWAIRGRIETCNTFNHAQFFGPTAINGEITNSAFAQVVSAGAPHLVQAAVKLTF